MSRVERGTQLFSRSSYLSALRPMLHNFRAGAGLGPSSDRTFVEQA
jgi:hypothetical protein